MAMETGISRVLRLVRGSLEERPPALGLGCLRLPPFTLLQKAASHFRRMKDIGGSGEQFVARRSRWFSDISLSRAHGGGSGRRVGEGQLTDQAASSRAVGKRQGHLGSGIPETPLHHGEADVRLEAWRPGDRGHLAGEGPGHTE